MPRLHPSDPRRLERDRLRRNHELDQDDGSYYSDDQEDAQSQRHHQSRKKHHSHSQTSRRSTLSDTESDCTDRDKENRHSSRYSNKMAQTRSKTSGNSPPAKKFKGGKKKTTEPEEEETIQEPSEVEKLKAKIVRLENQKTQVKANTKSKSEMTSEEKRWGNDVTTAYTKYIFGKVKFIFTNKRLKKVCKKLLEKWNLKEFDGLSGRELVKAQAEWIENNSNLVRVAYLHCHNYSQSQLRTFVTTKMILGEKVPTPEQVLLCAKRDKSMMTKENQWIFDMYVDVLLFKVMGKQHWDQKFRHYKTVSKAMHGEGDDALPCITPNSEAYLVTLYQNCFKRWKYIAECNKKKVVVDRTHKEAKTKFIVSDKGQQPFGGWKTEGRDHCAKLEEEIKEARQQNHVEAMEQSCLQRLRINANIVDAQGNAVEKKNSKKRKAIEEEEEEEDNADLDF